MWLAGNAEPLIVVIVSRLQAWAAWSEHCVCVYECARECVFLRIRYTPKLRLRVSEDLLSVYIPVKLQTLMGRYRIDGGEEGRKEGRWRGEKSVKKKNRKLLPHYSYCKIRRLT